MSKTATFFGFPGRVLTGSFYLLFVLIVGGIESIQIHSSISRGFRN